MTGPVVLVTGAAGRLGTAIAGGLAARGARLVLVDRDHGALQRAIASLGPGADAEPLTADVADPGAPDAAVGRALERFGRLDALVNNAGIEGPIARAEDVPLEDARAVLEVNVLGVLSFSAAALRHFRAARAGRIVNLASGAGLGGTAMMAVYSASKHAVVGLTRSIAQEAAGDGVTVNAVCPGCVDSPMMGRIETRLGELAGTGPVSFLSAIPLGRYCDPDEVASTVAWLALEAPRYITGSAIVIDGGLRS
jgi:NAD(P)-dependent dehydrogenase (short-subunit alcohol dehydrogenase family)